MKPRKVKMPGETKAHYRQPSKTKRVLNEIGAKADNVDKLDIIVEVRGDDEKTLHDIMPFDCECGKETCVQKILMSTGEYKRVHSTKNRFVVIPSHVQLDIEEVVIAFNNYATVAKHMPISGKSN